MELTPQLLTDEIDFRIAVRGYDRHEVDDFLERVAVAVGQLQSQLTKAVTRAKTAEQQVEELGAPAESDSGTEVDPSASVATKTESEPEPGPVTERRGAGAPPPAAPVLTVGDDADLNDELRRTLVLAQRTADLAIREARQEADGIRAEADGDAERIRSEVSEETRKAREEARERLIEEIAQLEETRETMRSDTQVLDRYLGTERARVRETIQVLRRLVDEPESFRPAEPPSLSEASAPAEVAAIPDEGEKAAEPEPRDEPDDVAETPASPETATGHDTSAEPTEAPVEADDGGPAPEPAPDQTEKASQDVQTAPDPEPVPETTTEPAPSGLTQSEPAPTKSTDETPAPTEPEPTEPAESADSGTVGKPDGSPEGRRGDSERLGQLFDTADGPRDWRTTGPDRGDQGPHTQPVAAARFEEESDEAFLAELRRAMNDDEPLGPSEKS